MLSDDEKEFFTELEKILRWKARKSTITGMVLGAAIVLIIIGLTQICS